MIVRQEKKLRSQFTFPVKYDRFIFRHVKSQFLHTVWRDSERQRIIENKKISLRQVDVIVHGQWLIFLV